MSSPNSETLTAGVKPDEERKYYRSPSFWLVILGLCISSFLALLEAVGPKFILKRLFNSAKDDRIQRASNHCQQSSWRGLRLGRLRLQPSSCSFHAIYRCFGSGRFRSIDLHNLTLAEDVWPQICPSRGACGLFPGLCFMRRRANNGHAHRGSRFVAP
jgi:hypothetical protein